MRSFTYVQDDMLRLAQHKNYAMLSKCYKSLIAFYPMICLMPGMGEGLYRLEHILLAFFIASLLVIAATLLRHVFGILRRIHLPASVIAGLIGLGLGPQGAGPWLSDLLGGQDAMQAIYRIWKQLPAYLISVVFAELMLGKKLPSIRRMWQTSSSQLIVGYSLAWGQYVVGILLTLLVLMPFLDAHPLSSTLIVLGFQGGYGTAAGLGETYEQLGFDGGYDLALGMATAGKVSAILVGLALINIAVQYRKMKSPKDTRKEHLREQVSQREGKRAVKKQRAEMHFSADRLVLHFALLCVAILIGWCLREVLFVMESLMIERQAEGVMQYIPLFPMALIGGLLLQILITATRVESVVNEGHLHSISHSFLDLLIVVAIATLSLKTLSENWLLLLLLVVTGIGWNLLVFFIIAPRFYQSDPWVRGVGDFAHSTGATTTGLMLMKIIDPNDKNGARSGFNLKQPFYEPLVGGGVITALSLPLVHALGIWGALALTSGLLLMTLVIGWLALGVKPRGGLFAGS